MRFAKFLLIIPSILLVSCSKDYKDYKNRSYSSYYSEFGLTNIKESMYNQTNDNYFIYFYGENCKYCTEIKGAVLDYFDAYKNNKIKNKITPFLYDRDIEKNTDFRNYFKPRPDNYSSMINTLIDEMIGAKDIENTYFFYTPSIYFIKDNKLVDYKYGSNEIAKYFIGLTK